MQRTASPFCENKSESLELVIEDILMAIEFIQLWTLKVLYDRQI